jgi:hypothetical protein
VRAERDLYAAKVIHIHQAPTDASQLHNFHQLPPPPGYFTGRDADLSALEQHLTAPTASGVTISAVYGAVQGMGGVGKTALAVMLAHRLKDRYPDAQLFLNLRGADPERRPPVPPVEAMQSIIHCFHPEARLPDDLDALAPIYRAALAARDRRILLLLDNAAGADQVKPLLPPPNCLLLVTSRWQFKFPGLGTSNLDCLPKSLKDFVPLEDVNAEASQIGAVLAGTFGSVQREKRYIHRDGHVVWGFVTLALGVSAPGTGQRTICPARPSGAEWACFGIGVVMGAPIFSPEGPTAGRAASWTASKTRLHVRAAA